MSSIARGMWCGGGLFPGLGWCLCCGSIGVWRLGFCPSLQRMRGGCGSRGWLRIWSWVGWCGLGRWLGCRLGIGLCACGRGFGGSCCRWTWSRLVWWPCLCRLWLGLRSFPSGLSLSLSGRGREELLRRKGEGELGRVSLASRPSPSHAQARAGPSLSPAGRGFSESFTGRPAGRLFRFTRGDGHECC